MPRNMDTALLRAFVAVAETGGVTRAALLLHLTQAAVSQQLKRLEDNLGAELFVRDRQRMALTPAGERLLARAQRMLALNDEIWTTMTAPEFEGEVRLGVPRDVVTPFLPPVLRAFSRDWPRVRLTLEVSNTVLVRQMLARDELDLCLATEIGCDPDGEVLFADPLVWVGAAGGTAWQEDPLPMALGDPSCAFRVPAMEALTAQGRDWRRACESRDDAGVMAAIEADIAVGVFLRSTLRPGLAAVPAEAGLPSLPGFSVNLYAPRRAASPVVAELALHIRRGLGPRPAVMAKAA